MKLKIERPKGDAEDQLAPMVPDFYRRKGHTVMVIGELRRVGMYDDEIGEGTGSVTTRWLMLQPVVGEAAHRLRNVARALWAAQNPQGELFGDFSVDLSPVTLRHMTEEIGLQYYARLRFGVEEYLRQLDALLEDPADARSPQRWHEEVEFLSRGFHAVLDAAEEPGRPSDLGPDVDPTLPLDVPSPQTEGGHVCNAPLIVPAGDNGDERAVPCDLPDDPDSHPLLDGDPQYVGDAERVHAGMGGDGEAYAWPFT